MAITYIGKSSLATGGGNISVGVPSGYQADDFFLLLTCGDDGYCPAPTPAWTLLNTLNPNSSAYFSVYYKIAGSSESSVTVSDPGSNENNTGIMFCFRGVDTVNPINISNIGTDDENYNAPSLTTTKNNCMVVLAIGFTDSGTASDSSNFSSWNAGNLSSITAEHDYYYYSSEGCGMAMCYGLLASAGSVGAITATGDNTGNTNGTVILALTPLIPPTPKVLAANTGTVSLMDRTLTLGGYHIERKVGAAGQWQELDVDDASPYTDEGPFEDGETYYYRVRKYEGGVFGDYSNEASETYETPAIEKILAAGLTTSLQLINKARKYIEANADASSRIGRSIDWIKGLFSAVTGLPVRIDSTKKRLLNTTRLNTERMSAIKIKLSILTSLTAGFNWAAKKTMISATNTAIDILIKIKLILMTLTQVTTILSYIKNLTEKVLTTIIRATPKSTLRLKKGIAAGVLAAERIYRRTIKGLHTAFAIQGGQLKRVSNKLSALPDIGASIFHQTGKRMQAATDITTDIRREVSLIFTLTIRAQIGMVKKIYRSLKTGMTIAADSIASFGLALYLSIGGLARKCVAVYVGINHKARRVVKGYIGKGGTAGKF